MVMETVASGCTTDTLKVRNTAISRNCPLAESSNFHSRLASPNSVNSLPLLEEEEEVTVNGTVSGNKQHSYQSGSEVGTRTETAVFPSTTNLRSLYKPRSASIEGSDCHTSATETILSQSSRTMDWTVTSSMTLPDKHTQPVSLTPTSTPLQEVSETFQQMKLVSEDSTMKRNVPTRPNHDEHENCITKVKVETTSLHFPCSEDDISSPSEASEEEGDNINQQHHLETPEILSLKQGPGLSRPLEAGKNIHSVVTRNTTTGEIVSPTVSFLETPQIHKGNQKGHIELEDNKIMNSTIPTSVRIHRAYTPRSPTTRLRTKKGGGTAQRQVCFHEVSIRRYPMICGDNPACQMGAPVTLDWGFEELPPLDLDDFEATRQKTRRRKLHHLILNYFQRRRILSGMGYSEEEIKSVEKEIGKERFKREITKLLLPISKVEDLIETIRRRLKRRMNKVMVEEKNELDDSIRKFRQADSRRMSMMMNNSSRTV